MQALSPMPTTTANSRPRRSGILSATSNKSTWLERSVKSSKHFRRKEVTFIFQGFPGYKCPEPDCPAVPFCLSYLDLHLQSAHGKAEPPEKVDVKNLPESGKTSPPKRVSAINRKSPTPPPPQQQKLNRRSTRRTRDYPVRAHWDLQQNIRSKRHC